MGQLDRRYSKRKVLEQVTYIDMPGGNGGIVTDVSEGGLGFHVVSPLGKIGPVHFLLSGSAKRIAATGNVVWTDDKGKTGGLSFTEFPESVRDQIREWPFRTNLRLEFSDADSVVPGDLLFPSDLEWSGPEAEDTDYRQYFRDEGLPEEGPGKRRLLKAIGISSLAGMAGLLSYFYYREARNSKSTGPAEHSSEVITPSANSNSSAEIALLQNASEKSDVGGEALPRLPQAANASPETVPNDDAGALQDAPVFHQPEADEPEILFVQVAAVTQEADAYRILNMLKGQHFAAFISPPVNDGFYRVQLGPYRTPEAATASRKALQQAGYKPFIRR